MYKRIILLSVALVLAVSVTGASYALDPRREQLGVGVIAGVPSGLSIKYWFNPDLAADGAVGLSLLENSYGVHADLLLHFNEIIKTREINIPLYVGAGGKVRIGTSLEVGVRIPLGGTYLFTRDPFDLFLEVAPGFNLLPSPAFSVEAGIGGRFFFRL